MEISDDPAKGIPRELLEAGAVETHEITNRSQPGLFMARPDPCPKCGGAGFFVTEQVYMWGQLMAGEWHYIRCSRCGHRAPGIMLRPDRPATLDETNNARRAALDSWNAGRDHYAEIAKHL